MTLEHVSLWNIFLNYARIGLQGWGGPVAQIQLIHEDAVIQKQWMDPERFKDAYAICSMLPGPEAAELCIYIGVHKRGSWGGICAGLGFMLPNFLMITALAWLYFTYTVSSDMIQSLLFGVKPAMIAIVTYSLYRLSDKFGVMQDRKLLAMAVLMLTLSFVPRFDLVFLLLLIGVVYLLLITLIERNNHQSPGDSTLLSTTPWLLFTSMGLGQHFVPWQVSWLFLKIGALSFGGAYTVLALLQSEAVDHYAWLSTEQYIDGLAINELTPGPLIMVAAFVGFAAYGFWGATLATFFIFLPAFLFILLGVPYFEKIRQRPWVKIYLAGVSAAVVGLTANFLIRLSVDVFHDWVSPGIALLSLLLLGRWKFPIWSVFMIGLVLGSCYMFVLNGSFIN
jgi:chromate transporter